MAFECRLLGVVRLSIIGRFVFLESAIFRRFVWDFSEIWICGLYMPRITQVIEILQGVGKNNPVEVRLFHNRFSFVSKITENHE